MPDFPKSGRARAFDDETERVIRTSGWSADDADAYRRARSRYSERAWLRVDDALRDLVAAVRASCRRWLP